MDISFVIINWNTRALLLNCINSIFDTVGASGTYRYEIFVVDNGSTDGSPDAVADQFGDRVHLIRNETNRGFAAANNQALKLVRGTWVFLLNSDTVLSRETVSGLVSFLNKTPDAAMAGPRMEDHDGRIQNSFDNFPCLVTELLNKSLLRKLFPGRFSGKAEPGTQPFEVDSLIGACIAVRASALKQVGFFDEDYFFFLEETDLCLRMRRAGWRIYHCPGVSIVHLQGQSKKRRPTHAWIEYYRSLYLFFKKNRQRISYITLRVCRTLKLLLNLLLTLCGLVLTAGLKRRLRDKTIVYAGLVWWHIRLCPEKSGLRNTKKDTS